MPRQNPAKDLAKDARAKSPQNFLKTYIVRMDSHSAQLLVSTRTRVLARAIPLVLLFASLLVLLNPLTATANRSETPSQNPRTQPSRAAANASAAAASPRAAPLAEVRIRSENHVRKTHYTLGDIASIDGASLTLVATLSRLPLGRSPQPGRSRRLSKNYLRSRLSTTLPQLEQVTLDIPPWVTIHRRARQIVGEEMLEAIRTHLQAGLPPSQRIRRVRALQDIPPRTVVAGDLRWEVTPLTPTSPQKKSQVTPIRRFRLQARIDGNTVWRGTLRVEVDIEAAVIVATRDLSPGQPLQAADLTRVYRPLSGSSNDAFQESAPLLGAKLKAAKPEGTILLSGMLQRRIDVERGGRLTLIYRAPRLTVTAPGVALVDARLGSFIPVRNLQSGKVVHGILRAGEVVEIR